MPRDCRFHLFGKPGDRRWRGEWQHSPKTTQKPKRLAQREADFESMSSTLGENSKFYYDKSGNKWHRPGSQNPRK